MKKDIKTIMKQVIQKHEESFWKLRVSELEDEISHLKSELNEANDKLKELAKEKSDSSEE
jgi:predicted nuclease with TOPRIM domain